MSNAPTPDGQSSDRQHANGGSGGKPGTSTATMVGIAAVVVLIVVIVAGIVIAVGNDDDSSANETTTTEAAGSTDAAGEPDPTDGGSSSTSEPAGPRDLPLDGEPQIRQLDGYLGHPYDVEVPAGVTATITVSPVDLNLDLVLTDGEERIDTRQRGDIEELTIEGPATKRIQVDNFFGGSGYYEIIMRSS